MKIRRTTTMRPLAATLAPALALALAGPLPAQERETPPPGGTPREFRVPENTSYRLDNGLEVTLVPWGTVPKATISLVVRSGNIDEGPQQVWLADMTGDLLQEGTAQLTGSEIDREAARMGGSLNVNVGMDQTSVGGTVLSEFAPEMVRLVADVVREPVFPSAELERLQADRKRQVSIARSRPQPITMEEFRATLYPDHPYGRLYPTDEMLDSYTAAEIREFWDANYGAARSHLFVSGRFDGAAVREAIDLAFGDWKQGTGPTIAPPEPVKGREVRIIDRPDAPQSTIYLGLPVVDPSHEDWIPLQVTNTLLGGSFGSRITSNIREDKGYTYSPTSTVSTRYRDAYWAEIADVTTEVTGAALEEIFKEIDSLQAEPPSREELRGIQNYLAGIFVLQNSSRGGIIGQLAFVDLHGLGADWLETYVNRIYEVTPEQVSRMAREHLQDEEMLLVVTGDRDVIEEQIAAYGEPALVP